MGSERWKGIATAAVAGTARGPLASAVMTAVERMAPWRRGTLAVLTYHRVDTPEARPDLMPGLISATPAGFSAQIDALARHWRPVSLQEVIEALPEPHRLPPRAVLVTFDDAYRDFAAHSWPTMRAASVPATLFVPTAYPAGELGGFWWDRLWAAVRRTKLDVLPHPQAGLLPVRTDPHRRATMAVLRARLKTLDHDEAVLESEAVIAALGGLPANPETDVLGWDDLRALAADGVTLAPHTRTHPLLDRVSLDRAVSEIAGSHADLEREIGTTPRVLAYPSGAHGGDAVEAARRAGMVLAFTTKRGGNDLGRSDLLRLRRINVGVRGRPPLVRAQLAWASTLDRRRS